jgi:hypothetical protein
MNCLMDRMNGGEIGQLNGYAVNDWIMTNCTWHGGALTLSLANATTPLAVVRDSAFDATAINVSGNAADTNYAN